MAVSWRSSRPGTAVATGAAGARQARAPRREEGFSVPVSPWPRASCYHDPSPRIQGSRAIVRLRNVSLGSQVKLLAAVGCATAVVLFVLLAVLQMRGIAISRSGRFHSLPVLALASVMMAGLIALLQIAALGLLRLLPWRGPALTIAREDDSAELRRVFD
jgi:hypothetical protein